MLWKTGWITIENVLESPSLNVCSLAQEGNHHLMQAVPETSALLRASGDKPEHQWVFTLVWSSISENKMYDCLM